MRRVATHLLGPMPLQLQHERRGGLLLRAACRTKRCDLIGQPHVPVENRLAAVGRAKQVAACAAGLSVRQGRCWSKRGPGGALEGAQAQAPGKASWAQAADQVSDEARKDGRARPVLLQGTAMLILALAKPVARHPSPRNCPPAPNAMGGPQSARGATPTTPAGGVRPGAHAARARVPSAEAA